MTDFAAGYDEDESGLDADDLCENCDGSGVDPYDDDICPFCGGVGA